jgi:hypothetical protein
MRKILLFFSPPHNLMSAQGYLGPFVLIFNLALNTLYYCLCLTKPTWFEIGFNQTKKMS